MPAIPIVHPVYERTRQAVFDFLSGNSVNIEVDLSKRKPDDKVYHTAVMMDAFYETLDTVIEKSKVEASAKGMHVSCGKGCSFCCYSPVPSTLVEALVIAVYLNDHSDVKKLFLDRYSSWRSKIDKRSYDSSMSSHMGNLSTNLGSMPNFEWSAVACPFLDNHNCSIYAVRPLACRTHLSIDEPSKCDLSNKDKVILLRSGDINLTSLKKGAIDQIVTSGLNLPVVTMGLFPITVYEFLTNGHKYIDFIREKTTQPKR